MTTLNQVDIEQGTVEVAEFKQTDAALAQLREKYSVIPDASTTEGYEFVKAGCKELTGLRTAIENKRKEIKAPYIAAGQIIDAEAKRITAAIVELEDPLKAVKKEIDDREKRLKEERLARLNEKINNIRANVFNARSLDSAGIASLISAVDAIDATKDFYELTNEAVTARAETLKELGEMYERQLSFEENERVRLEEEAKRKALEQAREIDERINNLKMMPLKFMQQSKLNIEMQVQRLRNYVPAQGEFGERWEEAESARLEVINQLEFMASQKPDEQPVPDNQPVSLGEPKTEKEQAPKPEPKAVPESKAIHPAKMGTMVVTYPVHLLHDLQQAVNSIPGVFSQLISD